MFQYRMERWTISKIVHLFESLLPMNWHMAMVESNHQIKQVLETKQREEQYETKSIISFTCSIHDRNDGNGMWQQLTAQSL